MKRNFVWIDLESLGPPRGNVEIDGVRIVVDLAPSNRPTAVFGRLLKKPRRFEVGFEYTDNEPEGRRHVIDSVTFVEGRHSGKLLRIEVEADGVDVVELQTRLADAANRRTRALDPEEDVDRPFGQFLNSRAATSVIANEELFRSITSGLVAAT